MAYIDYEYYKTLYDDKAIPEIDFNRLSWDACRKLDVLTSGIDNVKKLKIAFPTDEDDAEAVKRCICKLIDTMSQIEKAADVIIQGRGYIETANGLQGKVVSSVSAGNESISYSAGGKNETVIDKALVDKSVQEKLYIDIVTECLSGVADANGVNLLYMGRYPYRIE